MNYNEIMKELAEYKRMQEQTQAIIEGLQDKLKEIMTNSNTDVLIGDEHKATYKAVQAARIDTRALKKDMPDIARQYTKTTTTRRFCFS